MGDALKMLESPSSSSQPQEVVIVQQVNDNSAANFGVRLDGSNYQLWHKLMKVHISGVGKWGYITGSVARPLPDSTQFATWDTANSNVMGTLLKSMTSEELDQRQPNPMTSADDINTYRLEKDKMRYHIFLNGLDSSLDGAKGELLRLIQPPTLEQAFAYVRKDEANRAAMKNVHTEVSSLTITSRLAPVHPQSTTPPAYRRPPPGFPDNRKCAYCKEPGHIQEKCFKLHGYPASWKGGNTNNSSWKGGNSNYKSKAAVQLVQAPDFYGAVGQDHSGGNWIFSHRRSLARET